MSIEPGQFAPVDPRACFGQECVEGAAPWRVLAAAVVAQTGSAVLQQGLPTLTGFIKQDLGVSAGLVVSTMNVGRAAASYRAGRAVDELGERRVLIAAGLLAGATAAIAVTLPIWLFAGAFAVVGAFIATATPAGGKLVLPSFGARRHDLRAKAAVVGPTKTLAKEWGGFRVNVNAVAFGLIDTRLTVVKTEETRINLGDRTLQVGIPKQLRSALTASIPFGRAGTPFALPAPRHQPPISCKTARNNESRGMRQRAI